MFEGAFGPAQTAEGVLANLVGDPGVELALVVEFEGRVVSVGGLKFKPAFPGAGWLHDLGTLPEYQGSGFGRFLSVRLLDAMVDRGYARAILDTHAYRVRALSLYFGLGFVPLFVHDRDPVEWELTLAELGRELKAPYGLR